MTTTTHTPVDYAKAAACFRKQKAALTRAVGSGATDKVLAACRAAVAQWNQPGMFWPDHWADWQRALDDCLLADPAYRHVAYIDLRDLA